MIPVVVAIGVVIAGLSVTATYVVLVAQKNNKNSEDTEFKCPECGASVDGTTEICPECRAEFKVGEFECPVCGSAVTADTNMCISCNERFEEEEIFECPNCSSPIHPDTIVCAKCDEEFWSPVMPASIAEVDPLSMEESQDDTGEVTSS